MPGSGENEPKIGGGQAKPKSVEKGVLEQALTLLASLEAQHWKLMFPEHLGPMLEVLHPLSHFSQQP